MVFQRFYFLRRQIGGHKCLIKANFILLRYFKIQPENAGTCLMWLYSYFLECHRKGVGAFSLCIVLPLNYLSEWSPMERRAPAQWFVTRPVSLRSLKTGTTQIPFLLVLYLFIALVCSTTVSLVYMSVHYRVVRNTFVCRALHALGRAAPTLGAPQSLGWAAPRFC